MAAWVPARFWNDTRGRNPTFRWPTRIGVLDGGAAWVSVLRAHRYEGVLYQVREFERTRICTLLVLEGSVACASDRLRAGVPIQAEVVYVVTPEVDPPSENELKTLREVARAKVAAAVQGNDPGQSTLDLVVQLSHACSLRESLARVGAHVLGPPKLDQIHIRDFADSLAARARILPGAMRIDLSSDLAARLKLGQSIDAKTFREALEQLSGGVFGGESEEATTVGLAALVLSALEAERREQARIRASRGFAGAAPRAERESLMMAEPPEEGPRHLQARLRTPTGESSSRLVPDEPFAAQVRVGPPSEEWLGLAQSLPLPATPPPDPRGWLVRVVFWDALYAPTARVQPMFLAETGATPTQTFELEALPGTPPLAARVTLLFENQILQTGVLRAAVDRDATFLVDAAPQPVIDRPDPGRWFDAALILNHDDTGTARATVVRGDLIAVVPLQDGGLDTFVTTVDEQLSAIAKTPDDYDGLAKQGTIDMLRQLAMRGAALHRVLEHDGALDPAVFASDGPLQVVAARVDTFLPVEFLYVGKFPDKDAELCPTAEQSLREGKCLSDCGDRTDRVCPLQFWGLRRVVERHAFRVRDALELKVPFELRRADVSLRKTELRPLQRALVAASDIASKHDAKAVTTLLERLAAVVSNKPIVRANDWAEWKNAATADPSLLVLLPHHERRNKQDSLHIGATSELLAGAIEQTHLGGSAASIAPIVILMGCETQFTRIQFEDFVSAFRRAGAPIVVATVATILGRHAAPAAARIVEVMSAKLEKGPARFGEVMLEVRRALLADGMPMALGITAYGDADWLITN